MAAKLPLLTRKNIRDEFTNKKDGLIGKLKEYTGETYDLVVNFEELYPTVNQGESYQTESIGTIVYNTYESLVDQLKRMTDEGDNQVVKDYFNDVVSSKKINVLVVDMESGYNATRVTDGVLELVYRKDNFGTNTSYIASELQKELDKSFGETHKGQLPLAARLGFQNDFLDKKQALEKKIAEELLDQEISLVADPAKVWEVAVQEFDKLKKREQSDIDMESIARNMGAAIYSYFEGFKDQIAYKFKQDDLMVEGFMELCEKKEVRFELIPKADLKKSYNEAVFEDGVYIIRASPQTWYTNTSYACEDIDKLL
ncbi:hypothetical protein TWF694_004467 [Orbilia ellipsospora]|uniref:Uncharacterized protein n=1 Tax=Orbilia ellipsospora TaxID=2528407 RepID=A0AAV9WVC2_9PEZI